MPFFEDAYGEPLDQCQWGLVEGDRVTHVPIYELAFIWGVGPRVEEPGVNLIRSFAYSGPLEDLRLKRP